MEALFSSSSSSSSSNKKLFIIILAFIISTTHLSSQSSLASPRKPSYHRASTKFIRTSCSNTTYPRLCYSSLAKHAASIKTNRFVLTATALNVTLASARSTSAMVSSLSRNRPNNTVGPLKPHVVAALRDCVEELGDSVDELRQSVSELGRVARSDFEATMSDVQTWVSAALTDDSTCSDGFEGGGMEGEVKTAVRARIVKLAHLTSNALAFINQLASLHHA